MSSFGNKYLSHCVDILAELVSFDVLGGQSNLTIADHISSFLKDRGIDTIRLYNDEKSKYSIHARIGPSTDGGVILSGHTDVVPVAGQNWSTPPFTLTKKEQKYYARGSADMKGFLACCLTCVEHFQSMALKKPVYLAFSYDEEIGCLAAPELAGHMKQYYKENPAFAIIGEPTRMEIVVGQKGICVLETTVRGSAGHSSRIRDEVSAIHVASRLIQWLEQKMNNLYDAGHTDYRFHPPHTSIHVGQISGGIAPNVIADHCSFKWDVRTIPRDKVDDIVSDFETYCMTYLEELRLRFPDASITTRVDHPAVPPLDTPDHAEVVTVMKALTGENKLTTVSYAAEAGQFAEAGFSAVIYGPGDIAQAHRADEFIEEDQLIDYLNFLNNLSDYLC